MTPNNIDRYEVRGEIGRGGMATVLKGYDPRFKRDVAIKLLPREFLHDPQFRARFQREAQTIAALEHPAIVPVYDFGDADGQLYLVMRLMTGGSLADRLEKGPLSITETARIFERLAPALDSAHALGIIHRDLKPANILFDQWNNPHLSDFGIAKLVAGSSTALTATGGLVGTPAYMSPEQVRGVDALDGRSDIYAMGIILFQMLTGKLPYNANTPIGLAFMHVTEPVPNILDSNTSLPHAYQSVIEQAMAKERGVRPRTTVELADTVSSLALGEDDNRTILDPEVKETIVEPLPDQVETEQLETAEPKLLNTTNLPLTALEDELHQDKWGKDIPWEKSQGAALPQPVIELDDSTNRRVPVWGWGVLGLIVVVALIGLSALWGGRDEHADEPIDTAAATIMPDSTVTRTNIQTVLSGTAIPQPSAWITEDNADDVTQLARWGKGEISEVKYSPDGTLLAVASSLGIYLYDSKTLVESDFLATGTNTRNIAFSPDGQVLASGQDDGNIYFWSVTNGEIIDTMYGNTMISCLAFSPDGQMLAAGLIDGTILLWSIIDGQLQILEGHSNSVYSVAFSPDNQMLASGSLDGTIRFWSTADGELLQTLEGHTDNIYSITFSPDGETLASGSRDDTVRIWSVPDGQLVQILKEHTSAVLNVAFSPNGQMLASSSWDNTIRFWSFDDDGHSSLLQTLEGHTGGVFSFDFSSDGQTMVSNSPNEIFLWSVADSQFLQAIEGYTNHVMSVAFSPNGQTVASGSGNDNFIRLRSVIDGSIMLILGEHCCSIRSIDFSPDGQTLVSGDDGRVRIWSLAEGQILQEWIGGAGTVNSVAISPDGEMVAYGSVDEIIRLRSVSDGRLLQTLEGHTEEVNSVAFSPDGKTIASGSSDGTIRLWSASDGHLLQTLEGHTDKVMSVAFSPDGQTIASVSWYPTIRIWSVPDGNLLQILTGHTSSITSLAFSPDGQMIATGSTDETIRLWLVVNGQLLQTLEGHVDWVDSVAFSPDGEFVISGSDDGTIRLWGVP